MSDLKPEQRLWVAADFTREQLVSKTIGRAVYDLAVELAGTGVCIKVNTALRVTGYSMLHAVRHQGLEMAFDLKLIDIKETLEKDAAFLNIFEPAYVTVMCNANLEPLSAFRKALSPKTKVLGVTVPTTWSEADCYRVYQCTIAEAVSRLGAIGSDAGLNGFICAPTEAAALRARYGKDISIFCPGVRFKDKTVANDDQNPQRVADPYTTILEGATGVVMGRPIMNQQQRRRSAMQAVAEITRACA